MLNLNIIARSISSLEQPGSSEFHAKVFDASRLEIVALGVSEQPDHMEITSFIIAKGHELLSAYSLHFTVAFKLKIEILAKNRLCAVALQIKNEAIVQFLE